MASRRALGPRQGLRERRRRCVRGSDRMAPGSNDLAWDSLRTPLATDTVPRSQPRGSRGTPPHKCGARPGVVVGARCGVWAWGSWPNGTCWEPPPSPDWPDARHRRPAERPGQGSFIANWKCLAPLSRRHPPPCPTLTRSNSRRTRQGTAPAPPGPRAQAGRRDRARPRSRPAARRRTRHWPRTGHGPSP